MRKLLAAALMVPTFANAAVFMTGNELLRYLKSDNSIELMYGTGFVIGVFDQAEGDLHCAKGKITVGQVRDVVRQHLEQNPAYRDKAASPIVSLALMEIWPCSKKSNRAG